MPRDAAVDDVFVGRVGHFRTKLTYGAFRTTYGKEPQRMPFKLPSTLRER